MRTQHFLLIFLIVVGYWLIRVYEPFLQNIVIASLLTISTSKLNLYMNNVLKYNNLTVAILLSLLLSIIFFVPLVYFLRNIASLVNNFDKTYIVEVYKYIVTIVNNLPDELGFLKPLLQEFFNEINISDIMSQALTFTASIGKLSVTFIKDMLIILILYLFANIYSKEILSYVTSMLPMNQSDIEEVYNKTSNVIGVVFYSIITTAIVEGLLFGILVGFLGFNGFFFGVLFGFSSLIPIIGGVIIWLPVAIYEFARGEYIEALLVAIYSIVVISIIADTFIKPLIIKYISSKVLKLQNSINEMLIFFSIVAGISTFGFWGMIIGPAVTALFISILKLNKKLQSD